MIFNSMHSVGADLARGYSPRGAAACYARPAKRLAGPQPGGPVRRRRGPRHGNGALAPGALMALSPRIASTRDGVVAHSPAAGQWQGAAGELTGAKGRASGNAVGGGAHPSGGAMKRQRRMLRVAAFISGEGAPMFRGDGGTTLQCQCGRGDVRVA
jgi:hypothetical protein